MLQDRWEKLSSVSKVFAFIALGVISSTGCSDPQAPEVPACTEDADCELGQICHEAACLIPSRLNCGPETNAAPQLTVEPAGAIDFGLVDRASALRTLTLQNTGDCTLDLFAATLSGGAGGAFACPLCESALYPRVLYPGRRLVLELEAKVGAEGAVMESLTIRSSDPVQPELQVPLNAERSGLPALVVSPAQLDFGFVPAGRSKELVVQVINGSQGQAALTVESAEIVDDAQGVFSVAPQLAQSVDIAPARADPSARLALDVRYAPTSEQAHTATLVVTAKDQPPFSVGLSSLGTPPQLSLTPARLDYGAVPLGETRTLRVTLQNVGQAPLDAESFFLGSGRDLSMPRPVPSTLAPGAVFELNVLYTPTVVGALSESVVVQSNDPAAEVTNIAVVGSGQANPGGTQVVALEMSFQNGSSSALDRDLRDVDLVLESPSGLVVNEDNSTAVWGAEGTARWSASGADKNPERILLTDSMAEGTYPVLLNYIEDCATLPTALTASLLGIGTDELVDYLSEGEVMIDEARVAAAIQQACVDRRSVTATLIVTIDGLPVDEVNINLPEKGALQTGLSLVRENGTFRVQR